MSSSGVRERGLHRMSCVQAQMGVLAGRVVAGGAALEMGVRLEEVSLWWPEAEAAIPGGQGKYKWVNCVACES